jgi:hypothetical protein
MTGRTVRWILGGQGVAVVLVLLLAGAMVLPFIVAEEGGATSPGEAPPTPPARPERLEVAQETPPGPTPLRAEAAEEETPSWERPRFEERKDERWH